jgi:hypothetical protein
MRQERVLESTNWRADERVTVEEHGTHALRVSFRPLVE